MHRLRQGAYQETIGAQAASRLLQVLICKDQARLEKALLTAKTVQLGVLPESLHAYLLLPGIGNHTPRCMDVISCCSQASMQIA